LFTDNWMTDLMELVEYEGAAYSSPVKAVHVVGGRPIPNPCSKQSPIVFSPNSQRIAYAAQQGTRWCAVVDGQEGPSHDGVGLFAFSPDSDRLAYVASDGSRRHEIVDGVASAGYDGVSKAAFSPDSQRVAYCAEDRDRGFLVVDGNELTNRDYEAVDAPVFSPDSKRLGYMGKRDGKWFVIVDGEEGAGYDDCGSLLFSSDSRHYAHRARQGSKWFIVVDGLARSAECDLLFTTAPLRFETSTKVCGVGVRGDDFVRMEVELNESTDGPG
jgi:WD40 repeat protein